MAIGCSIVSAAAAAAYAYLVGPLLTALLQGGRASAGPLSLDGGALTSLPLLVVAMAVVKALAQWLHGGLMGAVGQRVMADLRGSLYDKLLALPPRWFESRHSGELLSRFTSDVAQVEFSVTQALSSYAKDSLQVLALLCVCAAIDGRLFVLCFVVLPAAAWPVSRFARSVKKVAHRSQASLGRLTELLSEQLQNLAVVRAFRLEEAALARFDQEQSRYLAAMKRSLFLRGAFTPTLELAGIAGVAASLGVGAGAISADPALAGNLLSFLAAALLMYQPLKALSGTFSSVASGLGAAERLFEISDAPLPPESGDEAGPLRYALAFENVTVRYADGRAGLEGFTLHVPAGKTVALVGPSGAGKSTVFSALLGFADVESGSVRRDGRPLASLKPSSVRAQLGWVGQEPVLFSGTVRQNLLLGRHGATDAELWEALERAHADDFVRALPGGLDAPIGERGGRLSGGQRQRLAIARALLRRPSVLLLDEPTSALDAESEREVQKGVEALLCGRTALVIAHRLSTIRGADLIAVLENGAVVEQGSYDELLARGGRFAALVASGHRPANAPAPAPTPGR